jgi:hypothetical protein
MWLSEVVSKHHFIRDINIKFHPRMYDAQSVLLQFQVHGDYEPTAAKDGTPHDSVHRAGNLGFGHGSIDAQPAFFYHICTRVLRRWHAGCLLRRMAGWS